MKQILKAVTTIVVIFALAFPPQLLASGSAVISKQYAGYTVTFDKNVQRVTLQQNGVVVGYLDFANNKAVSIGSNGVVLEENLEQLIQSYAGNPTNAYQMKAQLATMVTNGAPPHLKSMQLTDPYPCQLSPCPSGAQPGPNPWSPTIHFLEDWTVEEGAGGQGPDPIEEYDRELWEQWKEEECTRSLDEGIEAVGAAALTGATCSVTVPTVVGGAICGAALLMLVWQASQAFDALSNCLHATYPGRGNW